MPYSSTRIRPDQVYDLGGRRSESLDAELVIYEYWLFTFIVNSVVFCLATWVVPGFNVTGLGHEKANR